MIKYYYIGDEGGGGGNPPAAPAGYVPSTPQMRADWNSFLDYAGKQNVDFKDPKAGANLLAQYKKQNPAFSITPQQIAHIQYEQYQLRKGNAFGNLKPEQLNYLRQGMQPNYLSRPVADPTGTIDANTAKLYYPNMGSYGTDLEKYVNEKSGVVAPAPAAVPAKVQKVAAPVVNQPANPGAPDVPAIYANHDTALKRATQLAQMPGNEFLHNRADALINANYVPLNDTQSFRQSAMQAAKGLGLDPSTFWASAAEEGATGLIPDKQGNLNTDEKVDLGGKYPVSGYANFGLDNFHDQFKELVKKGYLPKDLDYEKTTRINELGQTVHSGNFKTVADALKAKAAYVRMEQDRIDDYAKKNNIPLSDKARQFFTLVNYNGGAGDEKHKGAGIRMLDYYAKKGLLKDDKFLNSRPESGLGLTEYYDHIHPRMQVADILKKEKIFD